MRAGRKRNATADRYACGKPQRKQRTCLTSPTARATAPTHSPKPPTAGTISMAP